jgi:chromosome segregation ATPase
MARKIITYTLISLSSLFLISSLIGVIAAWAYNTPLTEKAITQLKDIDAQLAQIQTDLKDAKAEVERALRIIESAEEALASLTQQTQDASQILEDVNQALDNQLIPGLETTRASITEIRIILEDLQTSLEQLNNLPFVNIQIPGDDLITNIITGVDSLDAEIANVQKLAQQASVFISDTSYLLGGDFQETKQNLQDLLLTLEGYDSKLSNWREQVKTLIESTPKWIDNTSILLTFFLLWFALSQFGLLLHGLSIKSGNNPLEIWQEVFPKNKN